jgi:hypothetical protein
VLALACFETPVETGQMTSGPILLQSNAALNSVAPEEWKDNA